MAQHLTVFGPDIWIADGPTVIAMMGFHYPTRMIVIRLSDGGLFVWSPIALTADLKAAVDLIGPVRHIVAPNDLHHLSVPEWQQAYPEAMTYAAPGLRAKRSDIAFDEDLSDRPAAGWDGEVEQVVVGGNSITTEVVFFHIRSGTVIFADLIQHLPRGWFSGWRALVARLDLMTGTEAEVPRKFRLAFTNRKVARGSISRILSWPADKVLIAHGPAIEADAQAFLHHAFRWLVR